MKIILQIDGEPKECALLLDALDMAISALKGGDAEMQTIAKTPDYMQQIPSEDGNDLIRRADAIDAVFDANPIDKEYHYYKHIAVEALKALPSAETVQGEWIWRTDISIGDGRTSAGYICSNCGKDYWHGNVFDFCPNCGAKMKGGEE